MNIEDKFEVPVKVKRLIRDAILPKYAHGGDAGLDFYSIENQTIPAGERRLISTGISMEFPKGYVAFVKDKSGVAYKQGVETMAGVIEYTYRGEYKILMQNDSKKSYEVIKGEKVAQVVILPVATAKIIEVDELSETKRGDGAFGSTGLTNNQA